MSEDVYRNAYIKVQRDRYCLMEQNKRYREAIILAHYKLGFVIDESVDKDERAKKIFEAKGILKNANVLEGKE